MKERIEQEQEIDLLKVFGVVLDKIHIIIIALIIGVIAGFSYSKFLIAPEYQSDVMLYVNNSLSISSASISLTDLNASSTLVDAYEVILNSRDTLKQVATQSGLDYTYKDLSTMITSSQQNDTAALKITVTANSPDDAYNLANTITKVLPDRINEIIDGSSAIVVDYAIMPTSQCSPNNMKNGIMAGIVVALLVTAYIVVVDFFLRDEVRDREELEENFDIPVLAVIPDFEQKQGVEAEFEYYSNALNEKKPKKTSRKTTSKKKGSKSDEAV